MSKIANKQMICEAVSYTHLELQEIVSIADRVLVLSNGLKTGEFSGDEIKEDTLVLASYKGHHVQNHEKEN